MSPDPHPVGPLEPFLASQGYVVIDGALATELERNGADLRDPLWSAKLLIEDPELIRRVHAAYLQAGADVITTASYQATIDGFMARGMSEHQAVDLLKLSVELALDARDEFWSAAHSRSGRLRPLVAASIGPYGAFLADGSEYSGDYGLTVDQLVDFHRPRLAILADTQADLLAFETVPSLAEGRAILRLLAEYRQLPAWIAFSCSDGLHVNHGERIAECASLADLSPSVAAVGINCTAPQYIESLVREVATATTKPVIVYPNSGEGWDAVKGAWTEAASSATGSWGTWAVAWHRAGARLIGGCCRTTPAEIADVRAAMGTFR